MFKYLFILSSVFLGALNCHSHLCIDSVAFVGGGFYSPLDQNLSPDLNIQTQRLVDYIRLRERAVEKLSKELILSSQSVRAQLISSLFGRQTYREQKISQQISREQKEIELMKNNLGQLYRIASEYSAVDLESYSLLPKSISFEPIRRFLDFREVQVSQRNEILKNEFDLVSHSDKVQLLFVFTPDIGAQNEDQAWKPYIIYFDVTLWEGYDSKSAHLDFEFANIKNKNHLQGVRERLKDLLVPDSLLVESSSSENDNLKLKFTVPFFQNHELIERWRHRQEGAANSQSLLPYWFLNINSSIGLKIYKKL